MKGDKLVQTKHAYKVHGTTHYEPTSDPLPEGAVVLRSWEVWQRADGSFYTITTFSRGLTQGRTRREPAIMDTSESSDEGA